jgi:hypothetical protein
MFRMLRIFQRTHGHCDVPYTPRRDSLGFWLMQQRLAELAGDLDPAPRLRLERLGVEFDHHDLTETKRERRWNEMFDALQEFKQGAGHCRVPSHRAEFTSLARWLYAQQRLHREGKLRRDRWQRLFRLGVPFETRRRKHGRTAPARDFDAQWREQFEALKRFYEQHGHCCVPGRGDTAMKRLHAWIGTQRLACGKGRLKEWRRRLLDEIGFVWSGRAALEQRWEKRFAELVEFKQRHGHCLVSDSLDRALSNWVKIQRATRARLSPERRRRLDEVGFVWKVAYNGNPEFEARFDRRLAELRRFKEQYGHCDVAYRFRGWTKLAEWVSYLRARWRQAALSPQRIRQLEEVGLTRERVPREYPDPVWEARFAELVEFKRRTGHCSVPQGRVAPELRQLAKWLCHQRTRGRGGKMPASQQQRLDEIGVSWDVNAARWEERFAKLAAFIRKHGHCRITGSHDPALAYWITSLRARRQRLPAEQVRRLNEIGFAWEKTGPASPVLEAQWEKKFAAVLAVREQTGGWDIPWSHPQAATLRLWIMQQRGQARRGKVPAHRLQRLEQAGFPFNVDMRARLDAQWKGRFAELQAFQQEHGHCNVPNQSRYRHLRLWTGLQRNFGNRGRLQPDRRRRLDELGFVWNRIEALWERFYSELAAFQRAHGHCCVPVKGHEGLHSWVFRQRHQRERLSPERRQRLDDLGFEWQAPHRVSHSDPTWESHLAHLIAFHAGHGHWEVPHGYADDPGLQFWVWQQRKLHQRGRLAEHRRRKLEEAGFTFAMPDRKQHARRRQIEKAGLRATFDEGAEAQLWEQRFGDLIAFHHRHGRANVTCSDPDRVLYGWILEQRRLHKAGRLDAARRQRLEQLGFSWDPVGEGWARRFAELAAYKQQHGHCRVSRAENKPLEAWIVGQRARQQSLTPDQRRQLDEIGFIWDAGREFWEERFAELAAFHRQHGHCRVPWQQQGKLNNLYMWARKQRLHRAQLSLDQQRRLDALDFDWDPAGEVWEQRFAELVAFKNRHSHCQPLPSQDHRLWSWCNTQRRARERLHPEQRRRLEELGFTWDQPDLKRLRVDTRWERLFNELLSLRAQTGEWAAPPGHPRAEALRVWMNRQRMDWRRGSLSETRRCLLAEAGFPFDLEAAAWERHFASLLEFKRQLGHCNAPPRHPDPGLRTWIARVRADKRRGVLPPQAVRRLEEIGFSWAPVADQWEKNFAALAAFQREHGHCRVTVMMNSTLASWVSMTRCHSEKLTAEQKRRLDAIGFIWDGLGARLDACEEIWDRELASLIAFHERLGHWEVPHQWPENPRLRRWAVEQRRLACVGELSPRRRAKLEQAGFPMEPAPDPRWETRFAQLVEYRNRHGHFVVLRGQGPDKLASWVTHQRRLKRSGEIDPMHARRLEEIGFPWQSTVAELEQEQWEKHLAAVLQFTKTGDASAIPDDHPDCTLLRGWLGHQRSYWRKGMLPPHRLQRLQEAGIVLDLETAAWNERIAALAAYRARHGHCRPGYTEDPSLRQWVERQRESRARLTADQISRLDALGIDWTQRDENEEKWESMFQRLAEFKRQHGHADASASDDADLDKWRHFQRTRHHRGRLEPDRVARLELLGFDWRPADAVWERNFACLAAFRQQHGHCRVTEKDNPHLASWARRQRKYHLKGTLNPQRVQRLEALGFDWQVPDGDAVWEQHLAEVLACYAHHGTWQAPPGQEITTSADDAAQALACDTPDRRVSLAVWVAKQRALARRGKLAPHRLRRLQEVGFPLERRHPAWEKNLFVLKTFYQQHGHCLVPRDIAHAALYRWCSEQRRSRQRGQLRPDQIRSLDGLGFDWQPERRVPSETEPGAVAKQACDAPAKNERAVPTLRPETPPRTDAPSVPSHTGDTPGTKSF